jgi:DNA polymerase V
VMSILSTFCGDLEIYSIDEAFLQYDGFELFSLEEIGKKIRRTIRKSTGIPVSIGFAETKTLAKAANRIAKKFPDKTNGVYIIDTEEKRKKALNWLKVEDVWGIGRQQAKKLGYHSVKTAFDFTQMSDSWIKKNMSVVGLRLKRELEGQRTLEMEESKGKKSIATTRTFDKSYTTYDQLKERVVTFSTTCAEKLRKQKSCCNAVTVFVQTNYFREELQQYSRNIVVKLPYPTNSSIEIAKFAVVGLKEIFKAGYQYKKCGVIVMDIAPDMPNQLNLFENSNPRHKELMKAVDRINRSIGEDKVKLAAQSLDRKWKMKQESRSPRYSTKLSEVIIVKI